MTPTPRYVVRNGCDKSMFVADLGDKDLPALARIRNARVFTDLEHARTCSSGGFRPIFQITYGLRWSAHDRLHEYRGSNDTFVVPRAKCERFETPAQAIKDLDNNTTLYGAGGADDKIGWKVVRFMKRVH